YLLGCPISFCLAASERSNSDRRPPARRRHLQTYLLLLKLQERYLCISDGFAIYCLDIKQESNSKDVVEPLPIISSLNLPEKGLPVLSGLRTRVPGLGGER
ncbi:hypothetical protein V2J09_019744, partial [Rumex salicifolius]